MADKPLLRPYFGGGGGTLPGARLTSHNLTQPFRTMKKKFQFLAGGFDPSEKYARQIRSFPQVAKNKYLKPPPSYNLFFLLNIPHPQKFKA